MTVTEKLTHTASANLQLPEGKISASAERSFVVESNSALTEYSVLASGPALGSVHPRFAWLYAVRKQCKPLRGDLTAWELTVGYENVSVDPNWNENPLQRPPSITWSSVSYEEDFTRDILGKPVLNSAGDYFDPPPKVQRSRWQVTYRRNRASVPTWLLSYVDAINSDSFSLGGISIPRGYAKLDKIDIGPLQIDGGYSFYEVGYSFLIQNGTWQPAILDQGLYENVDGERRRIRISGEPVTEPVLLDGNGKVLSDPTPDNAKWLTKYKAYRELPFGAIL